MRPIASNARAVVMFARPHVLPLSGVVPVIMLMHMPALTAAPQQPQNPHEPPGQRAPRFFISARHAVRSMSPPAFLYAVMSAAPTIV